MESGSFVVPLVFVVFVVFVPFVVLVGSVPAVGVVGSVALAVDVAPEAEPESATLVDVVPPSSPHADATSTIPNKTRVARCSPTAPKYPKVPGSARRRTAMVVAGRAVLQSGRVTEPPSPKITLREAVRAERRGLLAAAWKGFRWTFLVVGGVHISLALRNASAVSASSLYMRT